MTCHFFKTMVCRELVCRRRFIRLLWPLVLVTTMATSLLASPPPGDSGELSNLTYHSTVSEVRLVFFATDEHHHTVEACRGR
jgi:hypothetical protein